MLGKSVIDRISNGCSLCPSTLKNAPLSHNSRLQALLAPKILFGSGPQAFRAGVLSGLTACDACKGLGLQLL